MNFKEFTANLLAMLDDNLDKTADVLNLACEHEIAPTPLEELDVDESFWTLLDDPHDGLAWTTDYLVMYLKNKPKLLIELANQPYSSDKIKLLIENFPPCKPLANIMSYKNDSWLITGSYADNELKSIASSLLTAQSWGGTLGLYAKIEEMFPHSLKDYNDF